MNAINPAVLESTKAGRIVAGVDFARYRVAAGVNVSGLKEFNRSPLHFKHARENPKPTSAAMALGTAAHCATLEPERFANSFAVWTGGRRAGKEWDAFKADAEGRGMAVLTEDERDEALAIAAAVRGCPEAMVYLRRGHAEVSMAWHHDDDPQPLLKGRVDWLTVVDGADVVVGLKTTRDLRPRKFAAQAADLCYHWQWAFYCDGFQAITGRLPLVVEIVVESAAPHAVAVYRIPEHVLERGRQEYRAALTTLAQCETSGVWPGPIVGEVEFDLPGWAYPEDESEIIIEEAV
jgi:hypothetical protein